MKKNIIYDAKIIAESMKNNANRTGIYFTVLNILKELIKKKDINLYLYSKYADYDNLQKALSIEFPNQSFKIITSNNSPLFYGKLKEYKQKKKAKKQHIRKFFIQLLLWLLSPVKLMYKGNNQNLFEKSIFFSTFFTTYEELNNYKLKKYYIFYDLIPILFPKHHDGTEGFKILLNHIKNDDTVFAISNCTKKDFLNYFQQMPENNVTTNYLACNENFKPANQEQVEKVKNKYNINKKYIFSLCTLEPRKNLIRTVKTFIDFIKKNNIDDMVFVLGGAYWNMFIAQLEQEIENLGDYKDKIIRAGYVPDEDLAPLYSGAEWFVYTSMYEGFGLPPLEAMSCGCPVITSNNSSLPEVVGDAGIMIDWDSDEQHIEAYEKYYFNPELRKDFAQKGLERAKQFSWEKCVNQMLEVMLK